MTRKKKGRSELKSLRGPHTCVRATDQAFIAEVPELPGCAADGSSYQEAIVNAELVIREWIETAQEMGRPVPEPRGRLIYA